ncbi:Na+/H+ antiporter NhaA [Aliiroseovarius crassostreae]|uniref:Na(+)/H(+) antiporter NhaA n=1 Tax=Aliiroseovarius crassostreae TaxID=154981 RepID=A0A9Q9HB36_9RHOB|nr:Na+/H+ antiporter NhaA [Aliiroseovarius crassostreae]UWP89737.1 Na+/H+ antiporter NhaA [Aliiroseovarius crassostreae]UWP92878.1 Na+/H+ antiporter NhaA [Aliiroseovarius crassostreae]UWP96021.1 Na+/H+ antiporter NhaA [Aliiroseovarius crassostreae]UWP99190.1 Na+/H+ antiporter NhaA [Aliiroseovarius crassostreae]
MLTRFLDKFFRHDAAGGILLMLSAIAALIAANSPAADAFASIFDAKFSVLLNGEGLSKPLLLWVNDGLMAIFFFLIGLELKREILEGKLKNPRDVVLPGMAALGGMLVPAVIYAAINWSNPATLGGWAIPAATDIAFALGVLALLGKRAPAALKVFLLTLAILDDLGAIIVIALFYTAELKVSYLIYALVPLVLMGWLNMKRVHRVAPILMLGVVLWVLVLKSGVHATLAGVATAFFIPLTDKWGKSPLHALEHALTPYVFFLIVPIFAFANAGVSFEGMSLAALLAPVPLGIAAGLVLGKQVGVFGLTWLTVKTGRAALPHGVGWQHVYGISALAGIGFTMSLFIGGLSFSDPALMNDVRLGVLLASALSAVIGFSVLYAAGNPADERGRKPLRSEKAQS